MQSKKTLSALPRNHQTILILASNEALPLPLWRMSMPFSRAERRGSGRGRKSHRSQNPINCRDLPKGRKEEGSHNSIRTVSPDPPPRRSAVESPAARKSTGMEFNNPLIICHILCAACLETVTIVHKTRKPILLTNPVPCAPPPRWMEEQRQNARTQNKRLFFLRRPRFRLATSAEFYILPLLLPPPFDPLSPSPRVYPARSPARPLSRHINFLLH